MASFKIKFRASSINGERGVLYFQIIHKRVVRQILTGYKVFCNEWDKSTGSIITGAHNDRSQILMETRAGITQGIKRLREIIIQLEGSGLEYTADDIVLEYHNKITRLSFLKTMCENINHLELVGKKRTSETYSSTLRSFLKFLGKNDISLDMIDSQLMLRYEAYLKEREVSLNTISFYMRVLRAVYNRAVDENIMEQKSPFKHVYTGIDRTIKRAISAKEIKAIKEYDFSSNPPLELARDLFMFSFYTRGMSFVDMAYLKKSNLKNGILTYRRKKTGQQLFIKWEECMQEIIDKYSNNTGHLLPIIKESDTDERMQYLNSLSYTNKKLKKIAALVGLPIPLTMYVARHSWASIAKRNNIPISVISEGMGHDSESTTQIYLASLDTADIDRANHLILKLL